MAKPTTVPSDLLKSLANAKPAEKHDEATPASKPGPVVHGGSAKPQPKPLKSTLSQTRGSNRGK